MLGDKLNGERERILMPDLSGLLGHSMNVEKNVEKRCRGDSKGTQIAMYVYCGIGAS
jgi:hypothetical protein